MFRNVVIYVLRLRKPVIKKILSQLITSHYRILWQKGF